MPRRYKPPKRLVTPDPVYNSDAVAKFVNIVMRDGKRAVAERVMYEALRRAGRQARKEPVDVFDQALRNATPLLEVKPRRVGGATYQVPVEVRPERAQALAIRWLIQNARGRAEQTMTDRLSAELLDAANNRGASVKKREDTHRMAEANRAFSHYRW